MKNKNKIIYIFKNYIEPIYLESWIDVFNGYYGDVVTVFGSRIDYATIREVASLTKKEIDEYFK